MPLEREMLPDRPEAREKFLCAFRVAKAAHASLTFARRLVAVFGSVVQSGCSFDEDVLHPGKFWDPGFCRRITAQLIGDDPARRRARTQHTLEETFGGGCVAPFLQQDVEFGAMLVDRTPQQVRFATKRDKHFVEVPRATRLASHRFHPMSKALTKLVTPAPDGLVCHDYAALKKQFLDVAQAQLKAEIPPNSAAYDTSWETVAVIKRFRFLHRDILYDPVTQPDNALALDAEVELRSRDHVRRLPLHRFLKGKHEVDLRRTELLEAIWLPPATTRSVSAFVKFGVRRQLNIAIASVAVHTSADIHGYRIAVGSVAPMPVRLRFLEALLGHTQTCDFGTLDRATAMPEIAPVDDLRGTACYRRHLVVELAQQAIELAELRS
jgi:hypothetical protein